MSDENKSDEKLNATTPEFSPDSASAALRAAFLELSKSAWDIEKEIRSSSAELFDSADGYTKLNVGNENEEKSSQDEIEKKVQDEILGDMNGREKKGKQKRNRKRKNEQSRKADAETPLAKTSVSEKSITKKNDPLIPFWKMKCPNVLGRKNRFPTICLKIRMFLLKRNP